jgi:hypothetical protein
MENLLYLLTSLEVTVNVDILLVRASTLSDGVIVLEEERRGKSESSASIATG